MTKSMALRDDNHNDNYIKNNKNLSDQIKLCIMTDYYPKTISKLPKGTMEFFVRDGELAINYHTTKTRLRGSAPVIKLGGLSRSKLNTFLMLVESVIQEHPYIDYGTIIINYEILDDGEVDGEIEFKTQVNHRRR